MENLMVRAGRLKVHQTVWHKRFVIVNARELAYTLIKKNDFVYFQFFFFSSFFRTIPIAVCDCVRAQIQYNYFSVVYESN